MSESLLKITMIFGHVSSVSHVSREVEHLRETIANYLLVIVVGSFFKMLQRPVHWEFWQFAFLQLVLYWFCEPVVDWVYKQGFHSSAVSF